MEAYAEKLEERLAKEKELRRKAEEGGDLDAEAAGDELPMWTDEEIQGREDKAKRLRRQAAVNREMASKLEAEHGDTPAHVLQFCAEHLSS